MVQIETKTSVYFQDDQLGCKFKDTKHSLDSHIPQGTSYIPLYIGGSLKNIC